MRRLFGLFLVGAIVLLPVFSQDQLSVHAQQAPQKLTFQGDIALWSIAIKPDKTADFEQVMTRVKEALAKSERPEAKQQAAGWKVMKGIKLPDGNIIYTHVIHPVVPDADYTLMTIIYEVFKDPAEQLKIYNLYRDAFGANLGVNMGTVATDLAK
jgi:hypothetical protein